MKKLTVKDAIKLLKTMPEDAFLVGEGGEGTVDFIRRVEFGFTYNCKS